MKFDNLYQNFLWSLFQVILLLYLVEDSFGFDESKLLSGISFIYCTVKNIVIIGKHAGYNAHLAFVVIDLSYCGNA